ncbi:toll-like receptor 5 [Betta splendens]|uniref:Toll-like receptor 5 n=1 Tax=Betta splendens TaxID=158456 RepID=A0A6P7LUR4_BETSP|nr:toll-like receptor 5 [Betta splendens]
MGPLGLQVAIICVFLQVAGCLPSCFLVGSVANCASLQLTAVPALPSTVTHLFLDRNFLSELNSTSLRGLEWLQQLDLGQQRVPLVIRDHAFVGLRRLQRLVLGFNLGLQLEPRAFAGLVRLQSLHLDYCSLTDSVLSEPYLEPLSSLETLNLFGNHIKRLRPSMSFANMTHLKDLNLKLNSIGHICESDLAGFQGKRFKVLNLQSTQLSYKNVSDWKKCGNPFRGVSFEVLDLSHNGLSMATAKQFFRAIEGTQISHLKLSGLMGRGFSFDNLPDPDAGTFEGLKNSSLTVLDLSHSHIFELKPRVFRSLGDVRIVDVSKNKLNRIHRNAFEGLQGHLHLLNLSHNLLGEIYSHTFASLESLKVLDLSFNHLGALGYQAFQGLPKLKVLDLTGNSLRDLGFPARLPSLDHLLLSDNRLSSVGGVTSFAVNVVHLDVRDNRLTNLHDVDALLTQLRRLRHLLYGGNAARWCTLSGAAEPLRGLSVVDLHSSSLQDVWSQGRCLGLFNNFHHVLSLNLSSNALQHLPAGVFRGLTSVTEMDLSSNALTYLPPDVLPKSLRTLHLSNNFIGAPDPDAFGSLTHLDLRMNRFHCSSDLRSFLSWLNGTHVTFLSPVQELRCEFPSHWYGVLLLDYYTQVTQR